MRKVIGGKIYDTDKAELILTLITGGARSTQRDYYMTKKRAFFCHYVRVNDIELIPEETMKDILIVHKPDKYIEIFGDEGLEEG